VLQQDQEVFFLVNNPALLLELPHLYSALGPSLVLQWKTHSHQLLLLLTHLHLLYNSLTAVASTSVEVPLRWDHQAKTLAQGPIASLSKPKGQAPQRGGSVTLTLLGVWEPRFVKDWGQMRVEDYLESVQVVCLIGLWPKSWERQDRKEETWERKEEAGWCDLCCLQL
jgi:hypothetical protein